MRTFSVTSPNQPAARSSLAAVVGAAALGAAVLAGAPAATAAPASPAGVCTGSLCGVVNNSSASNSLLYVTSDWGTKAAKWISPGYGSKGAGIKDADGFRIDSGCTGYLISGGKGTTSYGVGWHQIHDEESVTIKEIC